MATAAPSSLGAYNLNTKYHRSKGRQPRSAAIHTCPRRRTRTVVCSADAAASDGTVLVLGASGGVGQLIVAKLAEQGYNIRAAGRSKERTESLFRGSPDIEVAQADSRDSNSVLNERLWTSSDRLPKVSTVICTTGTTAFPSSRWQGGTPDDIDNKGVKSIVDAAVANGVERFILVSSQGVERTKQIPFVILNLFGVLDAKRSGEIAVVESGLPYTIFRPGRLTDGPYTSYDVNTLLKATAGNRQGVQIARGDEFLGETSRIALADAVVMSLKCDQAVNEIFSIISADGPNTRPGQDPVQWNSLFGQSI